MRQIEKKKEREREGEIERERLRERERERERERRYRLFKACNYVCIMGEEQRGALQSWHWDGSSQWLT